MPSDDGRRGRRLTAPRQTERKDDSVSGLMTMRKLTAGIACGLALLAAAPAAVAGAAERVADRDFESTVCNGTTCTSPAWTAAVSGQPPSPATAIGPLCAPTSASGPASCSSGGFSGYNNGPHWARLGSEAGFEGGDDRPPSLTTSIAQQVLIPASLASEPATLSWSFHIVPEQYATGTFRALVDGHVVFSATDATPGYANYTRVTVPVGFAAGPGQRELRFEADAEVDPGPASIGAPVASDTFDVDDVSLDAPDPPAATPPAGTPPAAAPPGATGQRASALAKCKKKRAKQARRKCRRHAALLPA
jgi:hypothetical protein